MPVTWCYNVEDGQKFCNPGFPIGCYVTETGLAKEACVVNVSSCHGNKCEGFYTSTKRFFFRSFWVHGQLLQSPKQGSDFLTTYSGFGVYGKLLLSLKTCCFFLSLIFCSSNFDNKCPLSVSFSSLKRMLFTYLTTWKSRSTTMLLNTSSLEPGWLLPRLSQKGTKY